MTFISEYFIFDSLSNHLIEFFGNDEGARLYDAAVNSFVSMGGEHVFISFETLLIFFPKKEIKRYI